MGGLENLKGPPIVMHGAAARRRARVDHTGRHRLYSHSLSVGMAELVDALG